MPGTDIQALDKIFWRCLLNDYHSLQSCKNMYVRVYMAMVEVSTRLSRCKCVGFSLRRHYWYFASYRYPIIACSILIEEGVVNSV